MVLVSCCKTYVLGCRRVLRGGAVRGCPTQSKQHSQPLALLALQAAQAEKDKDGNKKGYRSHHVETVLHRLCQRHALDRREARRERQKHGQCHQCAAAGKHANVSREGRRLPPLLKPVVVARRGRGANTAVAERLGGDGQLGVDRERQARPGRRKRLRDGLGGRLAVVGQGRQNGRHHGRATHHKHQHHVSRCCVSLAAIVTSRVCGRAATYAAVAPRAKRMRASRSCGYTLCDWTNTKRDTPMIV